MDSTNNTTYPRPAEASLKCLQELLRVQHDPIDLKIGRVQAMIQMLCQEDTYDLERNVLISYAFALDDYFDGLRGQIEAMFKEAQAAAVGGLNG